MANANGPGRLRDHGPRQYSQLARSAGATPWSSLHPFLVTAGATIVGGLIGFGFGSISIVQGQKMLIALGSLDTQVAMLERLDALATHQPADPAGGRFSHLAEE